MEIRRASTQDVAALAEVFFRAVRDGPSPYSDAQRAAWAPRCPDTKTYADRLAPLNVVVAEEAGVVTGFMGLGAAGYVDLAFILPEWRHKGIFSALYQHSEAAARNAGDTRLWTYASLLAQPAFRAVGFLVMHHEEVACADEMLSRAKMEKHLI